MSRGLIIVFLIVVIAAIGFVVWPDYNSLSPDTLTLGQPILSLQPKTINAPPPLKKSTPGQAGQLTVAGVLSETNQHRAQQNLPDLTNNLSLNAAASAKLQDMFDHQYFDHVGPDGRGPSDWVEDADYNYISVGENLALGNFSSDQELVQAWMDSPGHRDNILETNFTEIGLAVGQGAFEGQSTWLAVQTFAKPVSACPPAPTQNLANFESKQSELDNSSQELAGRRAELDQLAQDIQSLADQGQAKIEAGNKEIDQGNQAASQGDADLATSHWERGEQLQADGQDLLFQAEAKQADLIDQQTTYNARVTELKQLETDLTKLSKQVNSLVAAYNACVSQ